MKRYHIVLLVIAVLIVIAVIIVRQSPQKVGPQVSQVTPPAPQSLQCIAASLEGRRLVGGLGIPIPLFPGAKRVAYGELGTSQYVAKAKDSEVLGYYADRMKSLCWEVQSQSHNQVVYRKENKAVKLSVMPNEVSGKVVMSFEVLNKGKVLGETVWVAQAQTCPSDQVYCTSSTGGSGWCQMPPCPPPPSTDTTSTPPPSTTTSPTGPESCTGGTVWCSSTYGGGWCQYPPCPSSTTSSSSTTSTPTPTTVCSGSYQQPGSTYPSCNMSLCPNGCNWGPDGCPSGCYASPSCSGSYVQPGTSSSCNYSLCPNGCNWSGGCPTSCYTPSTPTSCTGTYQQPGSTYPSCNYSTCPNGCTWDSTGCPSGCYSSTSSTPSTSCPQGQYWCNGYCISSGSYCPPTGGGTPMGDQSSCTSGGGLWCQPTTAPHCHYGPNPSPCEPDTPSGYTTGSCPSGQYWCNGSCILNSSSCSSSTSYMGTQASCTSSGGLWCQPTVSPHCHPGPNPASCEPDTPSGMYCPSNQFMCNGTCVPMGTSCSSTSWPNDPASCTASGKAWCTSSYGGSGWCQTPPCPTQYPSPYPTPTTTSCPSGQWFCNNACIPTSASCNGFYYTPPGSSQTICSSDKYFCPSSNSCIPMGSPCSTTPSTPSPQAQPQTTTACGQCQIWQNGACTRAPAGTADPRCNGGVCDQYGGCVTLQPNTRMVGTGAVCGDRFCEPAKGENRENCPTECSNPPSPTPAGSPATSTPSTHYPGGIIVDGRGDWGGQEPFPGGSTEEQIRQLDDEQLRRMKKELPMFVRSFKQMEREAKRMEKKLKNLSIGMPQELVAALAKAPEIIKKIETAKTVDDAQDSMEDLRDIIDVFQEWGPNLGRLVQFGQMLRRAGRYDLPPLTRAYNRLKRYEKKPELTDLYPELKEFYGSITKALQDAKALAKTDPEEGSNKLEEFYSGMEGFWAQVSLIDMMRNVGQALRQANSEIRRSETKIKQLERTRAVDAETLLELKETLGRLKEMLPRLKELTTKKPLDYEAIQEVAETFWQEIQAFQVRLAEAGQGFYVPQIKMEKGVAFETPESFRF